MDSSWTFWTFWTIGNGPWLRRIEVRWDQGMRSGCFNRDISQHFIFSPVFNIVRLMIYYDDFTMKGSRHPIVCTFRASKITSDSQIIRDFQPSSWSLAAPRPGKAQQIFWVEADSPKKTYLKVQFQFIMATQWVTSKITGVPTMVEEVGAKTHVRPHPNNIIYLSSEDEWKHWLYTAILTLGFLDLGF